MKSTYCFSTKSTFFYTLESSKFDQTEIKRMRNHPEAFIRIFLFFSDDGSTFTSLAARERRRLEKSNGVERNRNMARRK